MISRKRKSTSERINRELTPVEAVKVAAARKDAELNQEAIVREGRKHLKVWNTMRAEVRATLQRLKLERKQLGLSLTDIQDRSGIRKSVLSRLENDPRANPTLLTLQRYAAAVGLVLAMQVQQASS